MICSITEDNFQNICSFPKLLINVENEFFELNKFIPHMHISDIKLSVVFGSFAKSGQNMPK